MPAATTPSTPKKCLAIDAPIVLARPRIGPPAGTHCYDLGGLEHAQVQLTRTAASSSDVPACCRRVSLDATLAPASPALCTVAEPSWNGPYAQVRGDPKSAPARWRRNALSSWQIK